MISLQNIRFAYDKDEIFSDLSLTIKKGEFVSIIGANGSGKSTLIKFFNGLLLASSGDVIIDGLVLQENNLIDIRRKVGMVFQNPDNQIVASIVEDDVAFGPENLGIASDKIREIVDTCLQKVKMYEHRERPSHVLSGGQKQRIAIAGVLALNPEIIVFDEATSMLDPEGKKSVMQLIKALHKQGKTVIMITHFMEEAIQADRMIVMDQGQIVGDSTPSELFYDDEFCERYEIVQPYVVKLTKKLMEHNIPLVVPIDSREELSRQLCQLL